MVTIKRFCYVSLAGIAMVLAVPAQSETMARGQEAKAPVTNRLAANRLGANTIAPGDGAFTGVAAIDLPNGTRLTR